MVWALVVVAMAVGCKEGSKGRTAKARGEVEPLSDLRAAELPVKSAGQSPGLGKGRTSLHLVWMVPGDPPSLELASLPLEGSLGAGETWSEPARVVSNPRLLVNWADVPAVAETASGRVVVVWPERHGDDPDGGYGLRVAARADDGTFGPAWSPDDVRRGPETGFVDLVATPTGLQMFWLDGRELEGHHAHGGGRMQLRTVAIDAQGRQAGPSTVLDDRTCECCKLGVGRVTGPDRGEQLFAAYRDRSEAQVRDIYVAGPGLEPTRVAEDGWTISGCPVNGPAVATSGSGAHVAWFTGARDRSAVLVASGDPREGFGTPARVDLGAPSGRVDALATPDGGALISWIELDEAAPGRAHLLARRLGADGQLGKAVEIAQVGAARDWGFPRTALVGGEVLWVFTDPEAAGGPRLRARAGPLPPL